MANLNLIDPNEVVLGSNHPFKGTGLGIPDIEEIRSFVELTMRPRNTNYIELQNDNIVGNSTVDSGERITLTGYYSKGGRNYYSTNYTEDGRPEYEGFGMQDISIRFDANKIPEISITFYDFRGNVLNNFNSKFAKMFQLPYPVFELRVKGGFGPSVKYRLRKIKDDISIDDTGNFVIKSKFIGDRFSPLSDLPLNYLQAVPYLNKGSVTIDSIITSFHELIIRAKRMYEKFSAEVNSDQEIQNQDDIKKLEDKRNALQGIYDELIDKTKFENWFTDETSFKSFNSTKQTSIKNYVALTELKNEKILLKENPAPPLAPIFTLSIDEEDFISDTITKKKQYYDDIITKNGYSNLLSDNMTVTSSIVVGGLLTESNRTTKLDFTELKVQIDELNNQIAQKAIKLNNLLQDRLGVIVKENLGGSKLTIGDIFKFMFDDYNILMSKIKAAGDLGFADNVRYSSKQTYDKIGFPTVVDTDSYGNGAKKLIYPGSKAQFKNWPEVIFVEDFLESFTKSQVANMQAELEASKNEDGTSKYIPINPREIYKLSNTTPPFDIKTSDAVNIYSNKTVEQICDLIYERYLIFNNFCLNITASDTTIDTDWRFSSTAGTFDWVGSIFGKTEDVQRKIFLSTIEAEARNIAFALITAKDEVKNYFIQLNKDFTNQSYFTANATQPLSKGRDNFVPIKDNNGYTETFGNLSPIMSFGDAFSSDDKNYVTVSKAEPRNFSEGSPQNDVITDYMKSIHELNGQYKVTKDNILYIPDSKAKSYESDYDNSSRTPKLTPQVVFNASNTIIQFLHVTSPQTLDIFDFEKLWDRCSFPALLQIPQGMLVIMGAVLKGTLNGLSGATSTDDYIINIQDKPFRIAKDSHFYNYILDLWADARDNESTRGFGFSVSTLGSNLVIRVTTTSKALQTSATDADRQAILDFLYTPIYLSVNSIEFYNIAVDKKYYLSLDKANGNWKIYARWCKELLIKLSGFLEADKKTLEDKLRNYENQMRDNDVKLSVYKSFQVIYENYLNGYDDSEYKLKTKENFKFVDRAYNDISDICRLDIKTLLSDSNDTNVSMFTAISRLLSDNNFWFYPFQGWLTNTEKYNELFKIDYYQRIKTEPMFVAMYVGAVSSNPNTPNPNSTVANDGILKNQKLPDDFGKVTAGSLDAFLVKYTGIQNQIVFSDFDHSTESLKNTDEGLRIQSEVISTASNSLAVPKGQSLLNVYQKQSYVSTIKIPLGNMGIQPTQYYYLEFIPIFEGLYIIYNVEHSINASTQRLETTFKAYRLKKDINPLVTSEIIDFTKSNYYTGAVTRAGQQGAQPGVQIAVAPVAQTGTYNIYGSRGEGLITKYWQIKQHHPPSKGPDLQKYKVHPTPGGDWKVAYRDSGVFPRFKNDDKLGVLKSLGADYAYLKSQNDAYNMVVSDYVFKQGSNSKVGIPAPFDGKVVFRVVNVDGLPELGLIDSTGKKTCIMLHWSSPNVSAGDTIKKGQRLATQDTLGGGSTGVHLHIEGMFLDDWIAYVNFVQGLSSKYDGVNFLS